MGWPGKDGAHVSATRVVRIDCDKCGVVSTSKWPMNDRATEEAILQHLREKHGGSNRYGIGSSK
jgi:hypothetical protein